jgi:AcrR family transcriptional regulator
MRPSKLAENLVLQKLTRVFRERGYEGASYARLMASTGLVKASLYHRFPRGKEEIADAILSKADREFAENVLSPAREAGHPQRRAQQIAQRLRKFYHSGDRWCLLDTLTLASGTNTMAHARRSMEFWIDALARVAHDAGLSGSQARKRAQDAVAAIEGALIVSRVTKNRRPFLRTLSELPRRLTKSK